MLPLIINLWKDHWIDRMILSRNYMRMTPVGTSLPLAQTGEIMPSAYQPGVGPVSRENFETDHGYSAYTDLMTARYGKYFMVFNTTRDVYGNTATFTVELPSDFKGNSIIDMITGNSIPAQMVKLPLNHTLPMFSSWIHNRPCTEAKTCGLCKSVSIYR